MLSTLTSAYSGDRERSFWRIVTGLQRFGVARVGAGINPRPLAGEVSDLRLGLG